MKAQQRGPKLSSRAPSNNYQVNKRSLLLFICYLSGAQCAKGQRAAFASMLVGSTAHVTTATEASGEPRGLRVTLASPIESGVSAPGSRRNTVVQLGQTAHAKLTRTRGLYPHGLIFH